MISPLLEKVAEAHLKKDIPDFAVGDTVDVHCRIVEGEKQRIQVFTGTVISRKGHGINESFVVRRMVANEGVERSFPVHSPNVADIKVKRSGHIRRSKLFYLRDRVGKAVRLREKRTERSSNAKKK